MNRLEGEASPYLRQHAANPVDWRPWGEEAFARARAEQKPIFLSIGYSTCHWCHVMAHESFEDPAIAALLNEHFVPVKVDREERPDVDHVYMSYVQALTGHGGWPLSAWLTPELKPFFGGTYFPPDDRAGRMGFPAILRAIERAWREDRAKLLAEGEQVVAAMSAAAAEAGVGRFSGGGDASSSAPEAFERGFRFFRESFDPARGGFGGAPKFPRASGLSFLFRCAVRAGAGGEAGRAAVQMAARTLGQMARGGIHDHVGGGFHRYAVDAGWFVPHFEKMLYDQAQIVLNALEAWQATGEERPAWLARDILEYALRDLRDPQGGFYSAEDADSPSVAKAMEGDSLRESEGAFYLWTKAEIDTVLGPDAALVCAHFGVRENGNVPPELDPQGEFKGGNILAQARSLAETARASGLELQEANDRLVASLGRLRIARGRRPRPLRDDKILTAWNGLMISALARAAAVPAAALAEIRASCREAAIGAAGFVERELFDAPRGVLFRSWLGGRGAAGGFAEDYAFLIQGLLDLYEATFDFRWLRWAGRLQDKMNELFWDDAHGGYFTAAAGAPDLILRLKEDYDGATPAASSVAVSNLLRLDAVFGGHRDRAERALAAFRGRWLEAPQALPEMLCALAAAVEPPRHVVIAGDPAAADFQALAAVMHEGLGPRRVLLAADGGPAQAELAERAPWLAAMRPLGGRATAYVCEDFACRAPVASPEELRAILSRVSPPRP